TTGQTAAAGNRRSPARSVVPVALLPAHAPVATALSVPRLQRAVQQVPVPDLPWSGSRYPVPTDLAGFQTQTLARAPVAEVFPSPASVAQSGSANSAATALCVRALQRSDAPWPA